MSLLTRTLSIAAAAVLAGSIAAAPARAGTLDVAPPGANDWSCKPTAEHPYPVILVPGTFESMAKNWSTLSPALKGTGHCVFALNYGETNGVYATAPVAKSAQELASFVDAVRAATGAKKVDLVGHSQGGMMPRYYMGFLGGAKYVRQLVGIAPSNHGTEGVIVPPPGFVPAPDYIGLGCAACADQQAGSAFMQRLNSIGDTVGGPSYTAGLLGWSCRGGGHGYSLAALGSLGALGAFGGSPATCLNAFCTQALARASSPSPSAFQNSGNPV
jgi:hypothetical protein